MKLSCWKYRAAATSAYTGRLFGTVFIALSTFHGLLPIMRVEMPSGSSNDSNVRSPEELFPSDPWIAQALQGKNEQNRKDFVNRIQAKVAEDIQRPDGKKEVAQLLACMRVHCFQGTSALVKSGLTALGAVAIGLDSKVGEFLPEIMDLLLGDATRAGPFLAEPSSDQPSADHRVRYLACESLFNVAKAANEELLPYLDKIFDGLSRLVGAIHLISCFCAFKPWSNDVLV